MTTQGARILYVGHATVLVEMDGVRVLTDPLVRPRIAHLRRVKKVNTGALHGLDAVLISHLHLDHLDIPSLRRVAAERIVVPRGAGPLLRKKQFGSIHELRAPGRTRAALVGAADDPGVAPRKSLTAE